MGNVLARQAALWYHLERLAREDLEIPDLEMSWQMTKRVPVARNFAGTVPISAIESCQGNVFVSIANSDKTTTT